MSQGPFSRRAVVWIAVVTIGSLLSGLFFVIFGSELAPVTSHRADAYSRSALGHHAFIELLRRLGVPVLVSRFDSDERAGANAVLVLAEPRPARIEPNAGDLEGTIRDRHGPTVLVLPKRNGTRDLQNPDWIDDTELVAISDVERSLLLAGIDGVVVRPGPVSDSWSVVEVDRLATPSLRDPQLIDHDVDAGSRYWRTLIAHRRGVLVGETRSDHGDPILIVSDPDIFATHGLGEGENARLAVALIDFVRPGDAAVVFDETAHGHELKPTIWRQLFEFPLVLAVGHGGVFLVLLLWLAVRRFGAPARPPPVIEPGKAFLISNTAELLRYGGHSGHALRRYWFNVMQDVGFTLNAPAHLNSQELRAWLSDVAERRHVKPSPNAIARVVDELSAVTGKQQARSVIKVAQRIHTWREEMVHGPRKDSRPQ